MVDIIGFGSETGNLLKSFKNNNPDQGKINYDYSFSEGQSKTNYQIVLRNNLDYHTELSFSDMIRFKFFNKLFNEIEITQIVYFLNHHFDNYNFDKKIFLRIFEIDIILFFNMLDKGIKIMKIMNEDPSLMITEVIPFFKNYSEDDLVRYKFFFTECKNWIESKKDELSTINHYPDRNNDFSTQPYASYTVKSILLAYYYMHKKNIYPIPTLANPRSRKKDFYIALATQYGKSFNSIKNDWQPLKVDKNRLANPNNIKLAIKLLKTFDDPKINQAIELANTELKQAELNI